MSSAAYITFAEPVPLDRWEQFCREVGAEYVPNMVSGNCFYLGRASIRFGAAEFAKVTPQRPPALASQITVESFFGSNLREVARVTRLVSSRFGGAVKSDPELYPFLRTIPQGAPQL